MEPDKKPDNPRAFPYKVGMYYNKGIYLLDYFIAHAPSAIQWEFDVPMEKRIPEPIFKEKDKFSISEAENINEIKGWLEIYKEKRSKMWPAEWAQVQLKERLKHL